MTATGLFSSLPTTTSPPNVINEVVVATNQVVVATDEIVDILSDQLRGAEAGARARGEEEKIAGLPVVLQRRLAA